MTRGERIVNAAELAAVKRDAHVNPLARAAAGLLQNRRHVGLRVLLAAGLVLLVGVSHWLTPVSHHGMHAVHVLLRKLFVLPIVLAAIWFDLRGAVLTCLLVSVVYGPHVAIQWAGSPGENLNQVGEIGSLWLMGLLAGVLVRREKAALREAARTHEGSLIALVSALDAREHDTQCHSLRVRAYALRIGRELRMTDRQLRLLGQAALLHDVGKIGTPDRILLKPGPLSEQEWRIMRRHPEVGRRILSAVPFLKEVAEVVHCHHERFDGTGYPRGLGGTDIPAEARVFAVADVFDALTSDRPYHAKVGCRQAREAIAADSGTHFDPTVVNAFQGVPSREWMELRRQLAGEAEPERCLAGRGHGGV
jgi:putative nucleotidyltransferase with HDIG domain